MRIGARLYVSMLGPVIGVLVLGGGMAISMWYLHMALVVRGDLNRIEELAFEMELRMQECVVGGQPRAQVQWNICCDALLEALKKLDSLLAPEPDTRRAIAASASRLRSLLDELLTVRGVSSAAGGGVQREKQNHMVVVLQATLAGIVTDVARLNRISRQRSMQIKKQLQWISVMGMALLAISMLWIVSSAGRSIVRPIGDLHKGVVMIGSGHLDHRVGTKADDELGDLSRAFDKMVDNLNRVTASRDDLDREVAQRREAEKGLRRALDELKRSNDELAQFAYVASHDLQEPLRKVASFTQLLAARYGDKLDSDAKEFIAYAVDGAHRMQGLITDLLSYSRVGTRGKPFAPVDCEALLEYAIANLAIAIREGGAEVTHDPLPTVTGDDVQLAQLFQNLIGNAIKFRGEAPPRVHVAATRNDKEWTFLVRDNGIGIDPQYFGQLFVIFQRLHSRAEYPGTGIGLAICKKVVERHGGRIWVESEPGKGATFFFSIPER